MILSKSTFSIQLLTLSTTIKSDSKIVALTNDFEFRPLMLLRHIWLVTFQRYICRGLISTGAIGALVPPV